MINEKYTLLLEKQKEFITILNQSLLKHNEKLNLINNLRIKLQITQSNLDEVNQNHHSYESNKRTLE